MTSESICGKSQMVGWLEALHHLKHTLPITSSTGEPVQIGYPLPRAELPPHLVLPGHRSIVNQVRYSPRHSLMCSSGVEKVVKVRQSETFPVIHLSAHLEALHLGVQLPSHEPWDHKHSFGYCSLGLVGPCVSKMTHLGQTPTH